MSEMDFLDEEVGPLRKRPKNKHPPSQATGGKKKTINFRGRTRLRIGTWEYVSRHVVDLEAKCYCGRKEFVWEFLEGDQKSRIEIPWSHIKGLKVTYPETGDGTLDIELLKPPLFFKEEAVPQPRKRAGWQRTMDFTGFQASRHRHILECEQDSLRKNMDKIFQCSLELYLKSMVQVSAMKVPDPVFWETASVTTGMESQAWNSASDIEELEKTNWWDQPEVCLAAIWRTAENK